MQQTYGTNIKSSLTLDLFLHQMVVLSLQGMHWWVVEDHATATVVVAT
jgi:hypothetical protein